MPRVLLINPNHEDYLTDGVFHGLRTLLGGDAVDFPKAEYAYKTVTPGVLGRVRGGGFTLYGLLEDVSIDRDHLLPRAIAGEFDLVVFGDIWRTFGLWTEWGPMLGKAGVKMAVLDGADRVEPYPYSGLWWRVRPWWFLPRAHTRALYFKRELQPITRWFASYLLLPPVAGRRLDIRSIAFSIPAEKIVDLEPVNKEKDFPRHIVDPEVASRVGGQDSYVFDKEDDYRDDLERSRFGITVKREGWDSLRHYEIAACGAVPCFRDLDRKPSSCAPFGLVDGENCIVYHDAGELLARVDAVDERRYRSLRRGSLLWAQANSTRERARELLEACGMALDEATESIAAST